MGEKGPDRMSPFLVPMAIINLAAGVIAIFFGPQGPNFSVVSACANRRPLHRRSVETIRRGDADVMLAGGTEAPGHEAMVAGFAAMRALSTRNDEPERASRPFDTHRDGFVIGEGAGVLVLETLDHARARGVQRSPRSSGYGANGRCLAHHPARPGWSRCGAGHSPGLEKAGLSVDDVTMVNAHATSTPEGDPRELEAMKTLFGERAGQVSITANKSMIGHTLGPQDGRGHLDDHLELRTGLGPAHDQLEDPDPAAAA